MAESLWRLVGFPLECLQNLAPLHLNLLNYMQNHGFGVLGFWGLLFFLVISEK